MALAEIGTAEAGGQEMEATRLKAGDEIGMEVGNGLETLVVLTKMWVGDADLVAFYVKGNLGRRVYIYVQQAADGSFLQKEGTRVIGL